MLRFLLPAALALALSACGPTYERPTHPGSSPASSSGAVPSPSQDYGDEVDRKVVVQKMPDGSVKKTTITTRRRTVEAPPPPTRPADTYPADPLVKYNVERINAYRAQKNLPGLLYDAKISGFARAGSERLAPMPVTYALRARFSGAR
jgi:uncharacterized protein YkwD